MATVYKKWLKPENLIRLRGWKMNGLTDKQIAKNIGVAFTTVEHWKTSHPKIGRMLRVGKDVANYTVENELFQKAMRGNTACMIFFLKNNYRNKYSDTQDSEIDTKLKNKKIQRTDAQIKKIKAEAKIKEALAKQNDQSENQTSSKLDELLNKVFGNDKPN